MGTLIDLTGQHFGLWTVLKRDDTVNDSRKIRWICKCNCGTVRSVAGTSLRTGHSVSCGCDKNKKTSERTKLAKIDISGQRFGHWTVLQQDLSDNSTAGSRWICKCDCGKEKSVLGYSLRFGRTTSCGCNNGASTIVDLTGKRFGRLLVIKRDNNTHGKYKNAWWICKCDCGKEVAVSSARLRTGQTKSCGCTRNAQTTNIPDLTGQLFGKWTVIKMDPTGNGGGIRTKKELSYICKCECGTISSVPAYSLIKGFSKSCGCSHSIPKEDLTGKKFGKLTVIGIDKEKFGQGIFWKCQCICGQVKSYRSIALKKGKAVSCGCDINNRTSDRKFIDITGQKFGRLTAVEVDHKATDKDGNTSYYWKCICDCENQTIVEGSLLRTGQTKSCGCLRSEMSAQSAKDRMIDLTGQRFGLLTVIECVNVSEDSNYTAWRCLCDCGNEKLVNGYHLRRGMITSCGCQSRSKYEIYVLQYFDKKGYKEGIDYQCQVRFDNLKGYGDRMLSYDFAVYKNKKLYALIECQGQQHYIPVEMFGGEEQLAKQQLHDELKFNYASTMKVPLLEIPYTFTTYDAVEQFLILNNV